MGESRCPPGCFSRSKLVRKLAELDFSFHDHGKHYDIFRQSSSSRRVNVRRTKWITEVEARNALQGAGCPADQIASFIQAAKA